MTGVVAMPAHVAAPGDLWTVPLAMPDDWLIPPASMVAAARNGEPTKLCIQDDGRAYGHVASFKVPMVMPDGSLFHLPADLDLNETMQGHVITASKKAAAVGVLMTDRSHTDTELPLSIARDKFGHVGNQLGHGAFGYDAVGLWFAGAVAPGVTASQVIRARAGSLSGEWFPILAAGGEWTGRWEFLGAQAVNVPGMKLAQPVDRSRYAMAASVTQRPGAFVAGMWDGVTAADPTPSSAPPPRTPPKAAPKAPAGHTVKKGDSLWAIAKATLGDPTRWKEIYEANKDVIGKNPNLIKPGQQFKIPSGPKPPKTPKAPPSPDTKPDATTPGPAKPGDKAKPDTAKPTPTMTAGERAQKLKDITADTRTKRSAIYEKYSGQIAGTTDAAAKKQLRASKSAELKQLRESSASAKAALKPAPRTAAADDVASGAMGHFKPGSTVTLDDGSSGTVVAEAEYEGDEIVVLDDGRAVLLDDIADGEVAVDDTGDAPPPVGAASTTDVMAPGDGAMAPPPADGGTPEWAAALGDAILTVVDQNAEILAAMKASGPAAVPVPAAATVSDDVAAMLARADALVDA